MSALVKAFAIVAVSVALFLVTAKWHGRELRRERERAGYATVVFGGTNPPFIEELWKKERTRFWLLGGAFDLIALALCVWQRPGPVITASALLSWGPSLAFAVCAVLSGLRRNA